MTVYRSCAVLLTLFLCHQCHVLRNDHFQQTNHLNEFPDDKEREENLMPRNKINFLLDTSPKAKNDAEILENQDDLSWMAKTLMYGSNPTKTDNGDMLMEGDIAILNDNDNSMIPPSQRKATRNPLVLWPFKTVPYSFHSSVSSSTRATMMEAMKHWEENTCIRFRHRIFFDPWYINFRTDQSGCWSYIGNTLLTLSGQDVSIGRGCETRDTVVHELGHAIGFYHEQSRSDRDSFIKILWDNVSPGMEAQFNKQFDQNMNTPYDVGSIMQYFPMAFSRQPFLKNTIASLDPHVQRLLGKHHGLSFRDRRIANMLYSCDANCPNKRNTTCENGGYLSPYRDDNKLCDCVCPLGTEGELCQNVTDVSYYEAPPCGGNMTTEGTISTPNYPSRLNPYEDCSWWIQAPENRRVQVEFEDFSFAPRMNSSVNHRYNGICTYERVEIRTRDPYQGDMFCGTDISAGTKRTSNGQNFVILITANGDMKGRGLKANVTFV